MVQRSPSAIPALYEADETAWLEHTAALIRAGELDRVDLASLAEYLTDTAKRDRREVTSRLAVLLAHLLKWRYQPGHRSGSWRGTIEVQRQELAELLDSGVLRNHAADALDKAYANGIRQAAAETGLPAESFPVDCPYSLEETLTAPVEESDD